MARTPALSPEAAAEACAVEYGPRGTDEGARAINSGNRGPVRAWLTANGVPSIIATSASLPELKAAWRDETDSELNALKRNITEIEPVASQNGMLLTRPHFGPKPVTIEALAEPAPRKVNGADASEAAGHLAAALALLTKAQPLDESAVRAIVNEEFNETLDRSKAYRDELLALRERVEQQITDLVNGAPRRLEIIIDGAKRAELPAARHAQTETLLQIVALNIPAYIVGPAGSGKTTAAEQVASALSLPFYMQGATTGAHEFLGFIDAQGRYQTTPFRQAFEEGGLFLADEIDGSDPAALLVINAALANGAMAFPDAPLPVRKHDDFRMIAAANTYGNGADRQYVGRTQLDAATLDRFAMIDWPYDKTLETALAGNDEWTGFVRRVRAAVAKLSIRHVVSPRASIMGARMLAAKMPRATVEATLIWKGLTDAERARIRGNM